MKSFTPHPIIGAAVLLSLVIMLRIWRKLPRASRFMLGLTLFNLALTITHPNYQERYLLTSVPMLLICFGLAIAHGLEHWLRKETARWDQAIFLLATGLAVACLSFFAPKRAFLHNRINSSSTSNCIHFKKQFRNFLIGYRTDCWICSIIAFDFIDWFWQRLWWGSGNHSSKYRKYNRFNRSLRKPR